MISRTFLLILSVFISQEQMRLHRTPGGRGSSTLEGILFFSERTETSLATPSSLVLSLTLGNCVTAHKNGIHYQERGRQSLNFWTNERFILQSNELVCTMASRAKHQIHLLIVCLEKIENPPSMFGFALVWAIVPCNLETFTIALFSDSVQALEHDYLWDVREEHLNQKCRSLVN